MELTPEKVLLLTKGQWLIKPDANCCKANINTISLDSRTISPGDLFWAIKGDRFDGHDFVYDSLKKGALAAVVSKEVDLKDIAGGLIIVDNTIKALQRLAAQWRDQFSCPIIAVTGSSGKTTTKELIACILRQRFNCLCAERSLNNHIGVPLTLLRLRSHHQVGVLELGMNQKGEIAELTSLLKPKIGIITNIGKAHVGFLDSLKGILDAKAELLDIMDPDALAILNRDSPFYSILASRCRNGVVSVGESLESDIRLVSIKLFPQEGKTELTFTARGNECTLCVPVLGSFIAHNILMAVAVALRFGCGYEEIKAGVAGFVPMPGRMHHHIIGGVHILDDSYNANPESVHMALKTLIECKGTGRSVAILGDMLELGSQSECLHRQLGQWLGFRKKVDFIITYGPQAEIMAQEAIKSGYPVKTICSLDDHEKISDFANNLLQKDDWVLIKGSRRMKLDIVSNRLIELISTRDKNC